MKNLHRSDPGGPPEGRPGTAAVAALLEIVEKADDEQIRRKVRLVFVTWPFGRAADHHLSKVAFARTVKDPTARLGHDRRKRSTGQRRQRRQKPREPPTVPRYAASPRA